ncbi:DUF4998 domain-containing protein [Flagellimonas pacifica]|uniref:F5/8 type C domain-containing protein n=1 Tax=Flagellimonas pacifica TaxID=1247520 RepID=A0A285ME45_9FLAO|nr:DUF4998 domain-containing protein [Allomuricauda parva]SNY95409.1 protein of unknown function [Allomuricauda parva]
MKNLIAKIGMFSFGLVLIIISCETQNETFDQFTKDGETIYIGTPDTVIVVPLGVDQSRFYVTVNADPKISKGKILDLDKNAVHEFNVDRSSLVDNTLQFDLNLDEGDYSYKVVLEDDNGNSSIQKEVTFRVYGEKYQATLLSRSVTQARATSENVTLQFSDPLDGLISSILSYEDADGAMQQMDLPNNVSEVVIDSYKLGGLIGVSGSYKPTENAIEEFQSNSLESNFPSSFALDYNLISALKLPFDATDGCYGSTYERLTNGATGEFWHSCEGDTDNADKYPFVMSFDLGVTAQLRGFRLDERSGCCGDRSPAAYQIWATNDLGQGDTADIDAGPIADWETDAAAKGWVKLLDVTNNANPTFEVEIPEVATHYRYVRVVAISSIGGGTTANFDEFTFAASSIE